MASFAPLLWRRSLDGFVRAACPPTRRVDGFVRANYRPAERVAGFVRADCVPPLGRNCHSGRVGFVSRSDNALRPGRSSRYDSLNADVVHAELLARIRTAMPAMKPFCWDAS